MDNDKFIGMKLDGRYEITDFIGEGGMADVYKATDVTDNRVVAVKILKNEYSDSEEFKRRFRNESMAISVLKHPNIVKIYDMGFSGSIQYIVMEYVDGITLREYMDSERILNWKDAVHFVVQILRALQSAHSHGIVHRDIKPQNIMLLTDGTIKVMDFGIAKFAREESRTATDQAIGTVHYISPEQARGDTVDARGDLYSVGVMFYEMLTGEKPFDTDNPVSIAVMHMQNVAKRPRDINPNIPSGLEEIIIHAMEKDPNRRYQSATEMIRDIDAFKANNQIVFGYYNAMAQDMSQTRYMQPPSAEDYDDYDDEENDNNHGNNKNKNDDDEDDDQNRSKSLVVPIVTVVTIVVVVAAVILIFWIVSRGTDESTTIEVPNVVGMTYDDAKNNYPNIIFNVDTQEYTDNYEENVIYAQSPSAGEFSAKDDSGKIEVTIAVSRGIQKVKIPDLTNYTYEDAKKEIEALGLTVEEKKMQSTSEENIAENHIIKTVPEATEEVAVGSVVTLYVSKGIAIDETDVPTFVGMTLKEAQKECEARGLELETEEADSAEDEGTVIEQDPEPGATVVKGATVHLVLSNGVVPEGDVEYRILNLPSTMSGTYTLSFSQSDGTVLESKDFVAETLDGGEVTATVTGSGTEVITISISSKQSGKTAVIGKYNFDFDNGSFTAIEEDLSAAIDSVIAVQETEPATVAQEDGD